MTLEELYHDIDGIRAVQECRNCFGVYKSAGGCGSYWELLGQWANREDDIFAATWGTYIGKSGVANCYMKDHGDPTDAALAKKMADAAAAGKNIGGTLIIHNHAGDRFILADDGKTARCLSYATGIEIFGGNWESDEESADAYTGHWVFIHYGVDFIRDADGKWRMWHSRLIPGGLVREGHDWTNPDPEICSWGDLPWELAEAGKVAYEQYKYGKDRVHPINYPPIPEKYGTFDEVTPGYGVEIA